ncbi:hypothetical protein NOF04DRAFT_1349452 [Fusarium oxysporum II5]|nr:hypothetical protein NOF04DRAFT_1349452 [Fusarium oxysporum II5]
MSDQLSVEEIDDVELPGLDSNQIPRVLLAIKSMNDEQGQRIIQRLDPSKDNRIQNFGTSIVFPYHCTFKSSNTVKN